MTLTTGTVTQLWHALLREGEQRARIALPETHESYLVFALVRLSRDALLTGRTLALEAPIRQVHRRGSCRLIFKL